MGNLTEKFMLNIGHDNRSNVEDRKINNIDMKCYCKALKGDENCMSEN